MWKLLDGSNIKLIKITCVYWVVTPTQLAFFPLSKLGV